MAHDTTIPAQMCTGLPSPACEVMDTGHNAGRLRVEVDGRRFRVQTPQVSTQWLPDTPRNRHLTVVWLRLLEDERGEDVRTFILRKRKMDATVVEEILQALLRTPLAGPAELALRVNAQLGRNDLSAANIESALEQISCVPVLRVLRRQLETGEVHYQEAWLLTEMLESLSLPATLPAGWCMPSARRAGDPRSATRTGARLPLLADVPHDPVLLECAAVGLGPLVWCP